MIDYRLLLFQFIRLIAIVHLRLEGTPLDWER
jgi:hypothetical protein